MNYFSKDKQPALIKKIPDAYNSDSYKIAKTELKDIITELEEINLSR